MNKTVAYAIYSRDVLLPEVVSALNRAGFGNKDICMVLSPAHPDANVFDAEGVKDSSTVRTIAWFSALGAVFIPTIGFFIRSHSFFPALSSQPNFPGLSHGCKTLLGLGFPQEDATRLGRQLSDIGAMVYVPCTESTKAHRVTQLLRNLGAREASTLGPARVSAASAAA